MNASFPRHLLLSAGHPAPIPSSHHHPPRTVDYRHTIRIINGCNCAVDQRIEELRGKHRQQLEEKEREIELLRGIVAAKDQELENRNEEIDRLRDELRFGGRTKMVLSVIQPKLEQSNVADCSRFGVASFMADSTVNWKKQSFVECLQADTTIIDNQHVLRIKKEMKNTEEALNNVSCLLQKPKKKYEFFNSHLKENDNTLKLPTLGKRLNRTNHILSETDLNLQTDRTYRLPEQNSIDMSIDHTSTDQSKDMNDFLLDAVNEHIILKKALMDLQQSTKDEMNQLKQKYEDELRMYRNLLNNERDKNQRIRNAQEHRRHSSEELDRMEPIDIEELEETSSLFDEDDLCL